MPQVMFDAAAGFAVVAGPTPAETATAVPPTPTAVAAVMRTSLFTKPPQSRGGTAPVRDGVTREWEPLRSERYMRTVKIVAVRGPGTAGTLEEDAKS
ncbi:hypothetical protein GCM10023085_36420 [Actinomadura viridis]